jgi:hypothetical protein
MQIIGKYMLISLNFALTENIFPSLKEDKSTKTHNVRIKVGNGLLIYLIGSAFFSLLFIYDVAIWHIN